MVSMADGEQGLSDDEQGTGKDRLKMTAVTYARWVGPTSRFGAHMLAC